MKWLLAVLLSVTIPAFACDCNCDEEYDYSKLEASRKQFFRGDRRTALDGRMVCVAGDVFEVTGGSSQDGMYRAKSGSGDLVMMFSADAYTIPISRGVDEEGFTKYDCTMNDIEAKAKAKMDAQKGEDFEKFMKTRQEEEAAWDAEKKRRCEVEPQNYPEDCGHVLNPPREEENEHTESSPEDAGPPEQESGNETGPSNHKN